jgi:glycosyltransferase involved in cell wall biosynthesis
MSPNNLPLVSIVIPTYERANLLKIALEHVIHQTYENWEAIVIDNHSKDNTDKIVLDFSDNRIKLVKIHNHGSIAKSRNMGINLSKGEWIAFLDSDDVWYEKKLDASISEILKNPHIDVCCTNELRMDVKNNLSEPIIYGPYCRDFYKALLLEGNRLSPSATMVKKDFLQTNGILFRENIEFITAEDFDFWLQLAEKNAFFYFIPTVHGEYIIHNDNESGRLDLHLNNIKNVLKNHAFERQQFEINKQNLWVLIECRLLIYDAKKFFDSHKYLTALITLGRAFIKSPLFSVIYSIKTISRKRLLPLL